MSYILEALRKSQQERELGNVPTMEAEAYVEPAENGDIKPWVLAAVALAVLAVVIALYAALQARPGISEQVKSAPLPAEILGPVQDSSGRVRPEDQQNLSVANRRLAPSDRGARAPGATIDGAEAAVGSAPRLLRSLSLPSEFEEDEALIEPPPPKPRAAPPAPPVARSAPTSPSVTSGFEVPEDVLRDIETFKEDLRLEQSVETGRPVPKQPEPKDPRDLRLPKEVALRQPAFVMTVHVHEKERDKRFVVINARKYRQGDTTREGLIVEDILPDGAILSFEGHRFFSWR